MCCVLFEILPNKLAANVNFVPHKVYMKEKNRHLATFQNLCIIASADGALDYREKNLLYELAESMGLEQEIIAHLIQQAKNENLQFQLPTTEEDRLMELKLGVLMILADEKIEPEEYHACKQFATDMGISVQMLDDTIAYYQERQQEQKHHVGMFQNLFMMALADGQITEEEQQLLLEIAQHLGIQQSDIDRLLDHREELDLIIPLSEEDQYFSLKNLVYMMVVDGNIDPKEYALCQAFAEQIGKDVKDIEAIISEYQQIQVERKGSAQEIEQDNIDLYLDIFNDFSSLTLPIYRVIDLMQQTLETQKCAEEVAWNPRENLVVSRLMWLAYVRCPMIAPQSLHMIPSFLHLARSREDLHDLRDFLIQNEQTFGGSAIELFHLDLQGLHIEIEQHLKGKVDPPHVGDIPSSLI